MKTPWMVVGIGAVVAVAGGLIATIGNRYSLGVMILLGGLVVAVMGIAFRVALAFMGDKAEQSH